MLTRRSFIVRSVSGIATLYACRAGVLVPTSSAFASPVADDANSPWEARHNLSAAEYQALFDRKVAEGWRLTDVSGYEAGGQARYTAIWEQSEGPAWAGRHGLTAQAHQAEFDALSAQGFRPVRVNGFSVNGQALFASIWHQSDGQAWQARHGLPAAEYQAEFDRLVGSGWRLVDVSGYQEGGQTKYTTVWDRSEGDWVARHGLSHGDYQASFTELSEQGYTLVRVSGYQSGGRATYAAIWEKRGGPPRQGRHGISAAQYQAEFDTLSLQGFRPVQVAGYVVGGQQQFAGIWEQRQIPGRVVRVNDALLRLATAETIGKAQIRLDRDQSFVRIPGIFNTTFALPTQLVPNVLKDAHYYVHDINSRAVTTTFKRRGVESCIDFETAESELVGYVKTFFDDMWDDGAPDANAEPFTICVWWPLAFDAEQQTIYFQGFSLDVQVHATWRYNGPLGPLVEALVPDINVWLKRGFEQLLLNETIQARITREFSQGVRRLVGDGRIIGIGFEEDTLLIYVEE